MSGAALRPPRRRARSSPASRRIWLAFLVAAVAVVVFGASSVWLDRAPARPPGLTGKLVYHGTRTVRNGTTVTVVLGSRSFSPTYLRGSAGSQLLVHLRAEGFHAHTFTVPALGIDVTVAPGGVVDVPLTVPSASTTVFFCRFHRSQGMQGAILSSAGGG